METSDATLAGTDGKEVDMVASRKRGVQYSADTGDYAEAGAGMWMQFEDTNYEHAYLFVSTTSYLAKADFGFTKNSFVIGVDEDDSSKKFISDVCVKPRPGTTPVTCTSCPTGHITDSKGMYKYSVLAAAWNYGPPGVTDKGWEQ
jgi:ABC-type tungstate transport system permease subunit